jgi:hypothetical protein
MNTEGLPLEKRVCPFMSVPDGQVTTCLRERCAMFQDRRRTCLVRTALAMMAEALEQITMVRVKPDKPTEFVHHEAGPKRSWWARLWRRDD